MIPELKGMAGRVLAGGILAGGILAGGVITGGRIAATTASGSESRTRVPVVIDGHFEEWSDAPVVATDPADAPPAAVDLRDIKARHDDGAVYLLLDLARSVNVQALGGTISIAFDADGDPATGLARFGLPGVDLVVDLSPPYAVGGMPAGIGVGARMAPPDGSRPSGGKDDGFEQGDSYDVGFTFAPKYASARIEARVNRAPGTPGRFASRHFSASIVFSGTDGSVLDEVEPFTYALSAAPPRRSPLDDMDDPLARAGGVAFRTLSWNVADRNLIRQADRFRRVIEAVRPDLLLLDEVPGGLSAEVVLELLSGGEGSSCCAGDKRSEGGEAEWSILYGEAGGRQRGVIAARRGTVRPLPALARIAYPPKLLDGLRGASPPGFGDPENGVAALGALVEVGGRWLLAVTLDLQCCGNGVDTPQELIRIAEARAISSALSAVLSDRRGAGDVPLAGVLVAGDFNLVGSRGPLDILKEGLDLDSSDLAVADPLDLEGLTDATWSGSRWARAFPPGRLDFLLYSDSSLRLERTFVLDAAALPADRLEAHDLPADATWRVSDHSPIVADFSWPEPEPSR